MMDEREVGIKLEGQAKWVLDTAKEITIAFAGAGVGSERDARYRQEVVWLYHDIVKLLTDGKPPYKS